MASFLKFIFILALGIALLGANVAFAGDAASDPKATDKPETAKADGAAAPTTYKVIIDGMS
ncbi:MAG: hypothetical protein IT462_13385 [Planctomycetes bacterium]|nr:hypothetical protein [Planctomycetota bacterium]